MIKLQLNQYHLVENALEKVPINTLFAKAVINVRVHGEVYVDSSTKPSIFYIVNPCGMSLLFGNTNDPSFNAALINYMINKEKSRENYEWLQVYPDSWKSVIETGLGNQLVRLQDVNTRVQNGAAVIEKIRVNFKFCRDFYDNFLQTQGQLHEYEIIPITKETFCQLNGSVAPKDYWDSADQFCRDGMGYTLMYNGEIASSAFAAFRTETQLEIGVETREKHRGKGFAKFVCFIMIQYCIENDLEPVWACREENTGSYELAQKLGFVFACRIPYYRLAI